MTSSIKWYLALLSKP